MYALGSLEDVDQVAPPHQVLDVAASQVAPVSKTDPIRPGRPEPPMRLIGRGSGQAEACSGADRGRRRASWPKSEPTCLSHVVALVAPLELNIRAALGPNKLAYILQHAHLQGGNQARAARAGEVGRVRRGPCGGASASCVVRRASCVVRHASQASGVVRACHSRGRGRGQGAPE